MNGTPTAGDKHVSGTPQAGNGQGDDNDDQGEDRDDCDGPDATPGTVDDGADLVSQAAITPDQAIATAQQAASGTLGEVDLVQENGAFYYSVDIGNQEVHVDAQTGKVIEVVPANED